MESTTKAQKIQKPPRAVKIRNFDLLALPLEVRDLVYEEFIRVLPDRLMTGQFNRPSRHFSSQVVKTAEGVRKKQRVAKTIKPTHQLRQHGLLYVSKQVHAEYAKMLYLNGACPVLNIATENAIPLANSPTSLQPFWTLSPILVNYVQDLKVNVCWSTALRDIYISRAHTSFPGNMTGTLQQMKMLKSIEIYMEPVHNKQVISTYDNGKKRMFMEMIEVFVQAAFQTCTKIPSVRKMNLRIGYIPNWKGALERRHDGGWDVEGRVGGIGNEWSGQATYQLQHGENLKFLPEFDVWGP
ncbi:hypothetical protein EJ08DRAFT_102493 [Tothia fuscella]|uniref:Uncharacterized protein n=1 Tax=Tothia fuscella TaxID=1048955 RepID=A0A9P4NXJ6_9PEZI|nr:hypothetical protein EJ08DRAFT_102493 [Tothia fuscella]